MDDLFSTKTINDEEFRPIDKLDKFKILKLLD